MQLMNTTLSNMYDRLPQPFRPGVRLIGIDDCHSEWTVVPSGEELVYAKKIASACGQ